MIKTEVIKFFAKMYIMSIYIIIRNYEDLPKTHKKLAGMTGTAETEAAEFFDIYKLDVIIIPTNKNVVRRDLNDLVYRT